LMISPHFIPEVRRDIISRLDFSRFCFYLTDGERTRYLIKKIRHVPVESFRRLKIPLIFRGHFAVVIV